MQKTAQKRSVPSQLREIINIPGAYLEGLFRPELDRVMTALRALDDRIRSELTGKKIGEAEVPEIKRSAKELLKSARTNFIRREYMTGIAELGMFHKKMAKIAADINQWRIDVNKIHHKFLFQGLTPKQQEKIQKLREHMERKARMEAANQIVKEAGIMNFYYNFLTGRGLGLRAWEKKYPKETKALRDGGEKLLTAAENLLANTNSYLKEMATARAIRRPDDYMDAASKIKAEFDKFDAGDKGFVAYYQNAVLPWMQIKDQVEKESTEAAEAAKAKEAPAAEKKELISPMVPPPPPPPPIAPPTGGPPGVSPPATTTEEAPITERKPMVMPPTLPPVPELEIPPPKVRVAPVEPPKTRVAYQDFIESLESLSGEDPRILANFISKYAASIKDKDPETAISLFAIARQIKK